MSENQNEMSAAELNALVQQLASRVDELEARLDRVDNPDEIPEDVLLAICAAVAGYLGKRATVKQIHFNRGANLSRQGRSAAQQSHTIRPSR